VLLRVCCAAAGGSSVLSVHSLHLLYPLEVLAYPFTQETQVSLKIYAHADIIISQDLKVIYYYFFLSEETLMYHENELIEM